MKNLIKVLVLACLVVASFIGGIVLGQNKNSDNVSVSINGQEVEVVAFMYKYINENEEEIEGDYSIVLDNGLEWSNESDYAKEYQEAIIKIK